MKKAINELLSTDTVAVVLHLIVPVVSVLLVFELGVKVYSFWSYLLPITPLLLLIYRERKSKRDDVLKGFLILIYFGSYGATLITAQMFKTTIL